MISFFRKEETMMNIAICDDDFFYIEEIKKLLYQENHDFKIDTFLNGTSFLKATNQYDIIFMDIELPDFNGIDLLKENPHNCIIIILSSHDEEILNGYYIRAFRFLIKPIDKLLFHEAVLSAIKELNKDIFIEVTDENKITLKISVRDIVYAEAGDKRTGIRTLNDFYYVNLPIHNLVGIFNSEFYFVHRSYIVNMNYITKIDVKNRMIVMQDESIISVSRLKWTDFRETFYNFIKAKMNGAQK